MSPLIIIVLLLAFSAAYAIGLAVGKKHKDEKVSKNELSVWDIERIYFIAQRDFMESKQCIAKTDKETYYWIANPWETDKISWPKYNPELDAMLEDSLRKSDLE